MAEPQTDPDPVMARLEHAMVRLERAVTAAAARDARLRGEVAAVVRALSTSIDGLPR